ncbi:hypothetical protein [Vibrio owensii]|uniref:hypothetical protein n=1 Tax=Vibrio owensii TaxID=696485 RepID=UPI0040688DCC
MRLDTPPYMGTAMICFDINYFLKLIYAFYAHRNKNESFSRLLTFSDFKELELSTNSDGKIFDFFVYHLQLMQNEGLVCTFVNDRSDSSNSKKVHFGLTHKGYVMCEALFEKDGKDFLLSLENEVTFSVCVHACRAISSDIVCSGDG